MTATPRPAWRSEHPLCIGAFTADPATNELSGLRGVQRLRPILMDLLLRLVFEKGKVVSRETLINEVWPRRMVNDEVLSRAIGELRTALADDTREPRYIETLPKIGYRLIADVVGVKPAAHAVDAGATRPAPPVPPQPSIPPGPASPPAPTAGRRWRMAGAFATAVAAIAGVVVLVRQGPMPAAAGAVFLERQIAAAVPFTADPDLEFHARFSADERRIVFVKRSELQSQLIVQEVASRKRVVVTSSAATLASPVFFPDGKRIAYFRRDADGVDCGIFSRALAESRDTRLVECSASLRALFDLSADGNFLAFAASPRPQMPSAIQVLDLRSGAITALIAPQPGEGEDSAPRFSPDGRRVAFFRGTQSHSSAWLANVTPPFAPQRASKVDGLVYGLAWLGSSGPLIVSADWAGFRALNLLDLATGRATLLGARGARHPDAGRHGAISFEMATFRADLWLTSTADPGRDARPQWASTRYSNQAEFSPDGNQVVFASNRDGLEGLYVGTRNGDARRLPLPAGFRYIRPHWSRDGRAIYATRIALDGPLPTNQQAIRLTLADGRVDVLLHLGGSVNDIQEIGGGDLLVSELVNHAARLNRVSRGGASIRLPLPLVSQYAIAGNALVFTQPQLSGATRCRLDTLQCEPVAIGLDDSNRFDWALGGDAIWYLSRGDGKLVRHDLASHAERRFAYAPTAVGTNIAVSPDGKLLLLAREAPPLIDLMIAPALREN